MSSSSDHRTLIELEISFDLYTIKNKLVKLLTINEYMKLIKNKKIF